MCLLVGSGAVVHMPPIVQQEGANDWDEMRCMSNDEFRLSRGDTEELLMVALRSRDCEGRIRGIVPDTIANPPTSRRGGRGGGDRSLGGSMGASAAWRTCNNDSTVVRQNCNSS
jgi:hypothetical protein